MYAGCLPEVKCALDGDLCLDPWSEQRLAQMRAKYAPVNPATPTRISLRQIIESDFIPAPSIAPPLTQAHPGIGRKHREMWERVTQEEQAREKAEFEAFVAQLKALPK